MGRLICMTLVLLIVFSLAEQGMFVLNHYVGGHSMIRVSQGTPSTAGGGRGSASTPPRARSAPRSTWDTP